VFPVLEECAEKGEGWIESLQRIVEKFEVQGLDVSDIPSYVPGMRRQVRPFWCRVDSKRDLKLCKWYINRHIENKIIYYLSELRVTPNQLTVLANIVAYLATFLFFTGHLLTGSILTFAVSVIDGLDGKLARIRGKLTKLGNIEHSFDFLFEQSWYIGLAWFLSSHPDEFSITGIGSLTPLKIALGIVLFNGFATHCYMQFKEVMGVSLSDCAPFDRRFRRFDGRKNIYIYYILLGIILRAPVYSLFAILIHAIVTAIVYALRACKHLEEADEK
jgi:CDP-L-myo-inositol myo-inositolphosphotransferase